MPFEAFNVVEGFCIFNHYNFMTTSKMKIFILSRREKSANNYEKGFPSCDGKKFAK